MKKLLQAESEYMVLATNGFEEGRRGVHTASLPNFGAGLNGVDLWYCGIRVNNTDVVGFETYAG